GGARFQSFSHHEDRRRSHSADSSLGFTGKSLCNTQGASSGSGSSWSPSRDTADGNGPDPRPLCMPGGGRLMPRQQSPKDETEHRDADTSRSSSHGLLVVLSKEHRNEFQE